MQQRRPDEHHQRVGHTAAEGTDRREQTNADAPTTDQDRQHLAHHLKHSDEAEESQQSTGSEHDEDAALHERIAASHEYAAAHDNLNPARHQRVADEHHRTADQERRAAEAADPCRTNEHTKDDWP